MRQRVAWKKAQHETELPANVADGGLEESPLK